MKRISLLLLALALLSAPVLRAQDAATQERLDKLSGRIEDLSAAQESIKQQLNGLAKELADMRDQMAKPTANYARPEDLNQLGEKIKEVDRKRMEDADKVHAELLKLRDLLKAPLTSSKQKSVPQPRENTASEAPPSDAKVFPYVIQSGDTLAAIVQAYKDKHIKVTVAEILKANPGLKPERLVVGKKIFIPAPEH